MNEEILEKNLLNVFEGVLKRFEVGLRVQKVSFVQSIVMPERNPTEMGSDYMTDWRAETRRHYFLNQLNINQVAELVGKSRKTVSKYLATLNCFEMEKERRKNANAERRKDYKRDWDRKNRNTINMRPSGDTLRREHELAVQELSRERYYG